jgi:acyl-CoA thioester hydrolase
MPPEDKSKARSSVFHVRYAETDAMAVVHHANYLVYFEDGRSQYMRDIGIDYAQVEKDGFRLPVTETSLRYLGSLRYGDEVEVLTWVEENRSRRLSFAYEVLKHRSREVLVTGFTRHVWTDTAGNVTRAPQQLMELFAKHSIAH